MSKHRDFKAEYRRRIALGMIRGYTRSQARGHARSGEIATGMMPAAGGTVDKRLRTGVADFIKHGNVSGAAKAAGISAERLRRHVHDQKLADRQRGRLRPVIREMDIYSRGRELTLKLGFDEASRAGFYRNAVGQFLRTNDAELLVPFAGGGVTDLSGKQHPFETDPNTLYELSFSGRGTFENIYRLTVL